MYSICRLTGIRFWFVTLLIASGPIASWPVAAQVQRVLGLDISAWQGNISQTTWNNIHNVENRQFIILRSSRGGTTGYYNQNDANNNNGLNTLSQRYDDPYFVQNINRVTTAGMYAGSYHFSRPDIIETTLNAGGIANSGTDEADHFIQMAGPWMRPGYLVPVHDFEAGDGDRSDNELTQFCIDFSNRIYEKMGIRPAIYVNGNYTANILQTASASLRHQIAQPPALLPSVVAPCYSVLWVARWPNQANPNAIDVQGTEPKDTYAGFYGPWDDYGGPSHPWQFWQYASTGRLQSFNNGGSNLDFNVARGGIEFLKDQLVPAVWTHDGSGDWSTLTNWNSGLTPVAPVQGPGQVARVGTLTMPTPRLPGAAGTGVTSGQHDTVILERPSANPTITLSTGTHNVRKLYVREALNITGGSLTVNFVPASDSTTNGAEFSAPVNLGGGTFSVHTLQVNSAQTFTISGGALTFDTLNLQSGSPAGKLLFAGNANFNPLANATARIVSSSGIIDLGGGARAFNVGNGTSDVDVSIEVPVINGGLTKTGLGSLQLTKASSYSGGTILTAGALLVNNPSGSGTGSGDVTVSGGTLGGTGTISGVIIVNSGGTISPGTSLGTLTLNSAPVLGGTVVLEINRNGGVPVSDKLTLTSGTLTFDGTLVVTNVGSALLGGESFTLFTASAFAGAFSNLVLPPLGAGLNWDTNGLLTTGVLKVNRHPVAGAFAITNFAPEVVQISISNLLAAGTDADGDVLSLNGVSLTSSNGIAVTTNVGFIVYSNHVSMPDQINYTLSDGRGGIAAGAVQIVPSPVGRFATAPNGDGSTLTLNFVGSPGWTYYLERSTNLSAWTTIWTNVAPANGLFDFTDEFTDLPQPPLRAFYRLRWTQ